MRFPTTNPKNSASNGLRIIFAVDSSKEKYLPILVFSANEKEIHLGNHKLNGQGLLKHVEDRLNSFIF